MPWWEPFRLMLKALLTSTVDSPATLGVSEEGDIDSGNAKFSGQEAMMILDNVFIPNERIFMDGEVEFASMLVERFTCYHRRSYVCKTGLGDVLIGAAAPITDYNGVSNASHIKDKLVEMTHLNETIFAAWYCIVTSST